jgi:hypothetical protein
VLSEEVITMKRIRASVTEIILFESVLKKKGAEYYPLKTVKLGGY